MAKGGGIVTRNPSFGPVSITTPTAGQTVSTTTVVVAGTCAQAKAAVAVTVHTMTGAMTIGTPQIQTVNGTPTTWQTQGFTLPSGHDYTAVAKASGGQDDVSFSVS
jgi:hypothetical protein